ncbi:MAG: hypothetical protein APG12_00108 [Candidatus Methanofastidiosum methylothiophilum]|uniref:Uncharacterized protein n=1 Tax=Candidatus Methanofastidiosum methylothiophilum TaxID=1705564 RepID=A0A150ILC2_9EURY|nr:MAG: hypothetical protein APG10_00850 [Candidatus Methanofastidiosum methylthiophilus]KYC48797.1 MAG: hypothetical protein APG11_00109 [Candidatus Methanofastidiosum methylthiophilus]KYC51445.1 MAG: hypothetical protein APG12_00108 [Candidatus Methanofastidiosum methylthiophilus]
MRYKKPFKSLLIGSIGDLMNEMNDDYSIQVAHPDEIRGRIIFEISYQEVFLDLLLKKLEEKGLLKADEFKNEVQKEIEQNYGFYVDKYYASR